MSQRWAKSHLHLYYSQNESLQSLLYESRPEWKLTELTLRVTLRIEAYRACSTSHSPNGSLQSLLYESLFELSFCEEAS